MFVVIEEAFDKSKKGIFNKRAKIDVSCVHLQNRRFFYKIEAVSQKGTLPWEEIALLCGTLFKKTVLPKNIKGIEKTKLNSYEPKCFFDKLLLFFAVDILKEEKVQNLTIAVVDENAVLSSCIKILVPFSKSISVITNNPQIYKKTQKSILCEYGLSLEVREHFLKDNMNFDVLISKKSESVPLLFGQTVFSLTKGKNFASRQYILKDISLPAFYEKQIKKGTDRLLFAAALYELCDVKEMLYQKATYERYLK